MPRRSVVVLAALQLSCLVAGSIAAGVHSDSDSATSATKNQPAPAPTVTVTAVPTPTPTPSVPTIPAPVPPHLVIGPAHAPSGAGSARADLRARIIKLNPADVIEEPDSIVNGGFRSLRKFLTQFSIVDQPQQRSLLESEGFEGSEFHSWVESTTQERYLVDLTRFKTAAGATHHLAGFVSGGLHASSTVQQTPSGIPGGLAFFRPSQSPGLEEFVQYQTAGRYFCLTIARGPLTISHDQLKAAGVLLAKKQRALLGASAPAKST